MKIIAIDIDGVVVKYKNPVLQFLSGLQKFFFNNNSKRKDWHILNNSNNNISVNQILHENGDDLKQLSNNGYVIILLSSRPKFWAIQTFKSLKKTNLPFDCLVVGCYNKLSFCKENNVLVLIDDNEKTCKKVMLNSKTKVINFNGNSKNGNPMYLKTDNWQKIMEYINIQKEPLDFV